MTGRPALPTMTTTYRDGAGSGEPRSLSAPRTISPPWPARSWHAWRSASATWKAMSWARTSCTPGSRRHRRYCYGSWAAMTSAWLRCRARSDLLVYIRNRAEADGIDPDAAVAAAERILGGVMDSATDAD